MSQRRWARRASVVAATAILGPLALAGSAVGAEPAGSAPLTPDTSATAEGSRPSTVSVADVPVDALTVTATSVDFGLSRPTSIVAAGDGSGRMFITEKAGTVRVFHPDTGIAAEPLLDISDQVDSVANERGLLGIVPSPDFAQDPELYVTYTSLPDSALTLSRFPMDSPDQAPIPASAEEIVLTQDHSQFGNHNGGHIVFGPDGYLYWGMGDGGGAGDTLNNGQNLGTLLGTIVRIDVSRSCDGNNYCVPSDNPFVATPGARPEIWAYGLRNPWKFSFDAQNGSLWIADVGQGAIEEVNHLPNNTGGGNFGWSCREGPEVFNEERCDPGVEYQDPVFWYPHEDGACSVTGGVVYRGEEFADIADGTYILTDYCNQAAWGVRRNTDGSYESARIGELPLQITSFGVDASGEIYAVNDLPGQLLRIGFESDVPPGETTATCSVDYQVQSEWGNGFVTEVTVGNTGDEPISEWTVEWTFPGDQTVTNEWNAEITQSGATVSASNVAWNGTILAGESTSFGFQGTHGGSNPAPAQFALNGQECSAE